MIKSKESKTDSFSPTKRKMKQSGSLDFFKIKVKNNNIQIKNKLKYSLSKTNFPSISKIHNNLENISLIKEKISKRKLNKEKFKHDFEVNKNKFETIKVKRNIQQSTNNNKNIFNLKTKNIENKKINDIHDINSVSRIHIRNLELVKKLSEKIRDLRRKKMLELSMKRKTPMERFNNLKRLFKNKGITPLQIEHKKIELLNETDKDKKSYNDKIYYYEIIYFGNSSQVIEQCLKRRKQWKKYERIIDEDKYNCIPKHLNLTNINNCSNNENNSLPNFIWSHSSNRINFTEFSKFRPTFIKKMTNHFEYHREISNKLNLFLNMMNFCEANNLELFSLVPLTFPIKYDSNNFIHEKICFLNIFNNINKYISDKPLQYKYRHLFIFDLNGRLGYKTSLFIPESHYNGRNLWLIKAIDLNRGKCIKISDKLIEIENLIKHFYNGIKSGIFKNFTQPILDDECDSSKTQNNFIKIKNNIYENIKSEFKNLTSKKIKNLKIPLFKLPNKLIIKNNNKHKLKIKFKKNIKILHQSPSCKFNSPSSVSKIEYTTEVNSNINKKTRNNNILDFNPIKIQSPQFNLNDINSKNQDLFSNKFNTPNKNQVLNSEINTYQSNIILIQKYIEKPLCYNGRKCDMRLWVLLTWDFNVYLFKEGHFKASSIKYDVNSLDYYVHLTNYSVQKYCENFSKYEKGNEISFNDFEKSYDYKLKVKNDLIPKTKEIIIYSIKSCINKINKMERKICFEIFGYDFIFDEKLIPYLLEVNTNPGLEISSPLIEMLIPKMIDDAFKLTIDKIFKLGEDTINEMKKNPFKVQGYDDNENMWELLCNIS